MTNVRVERLQDVTGTNAIAEGFKSNAYLDAKIQFHHVWEDIYNKTDFRWSNNPWTWVYEFEQIYKPND